MLSLLEVKSKFGAEFRRFELDRKIPLKYEDFYQLIEQLHGLRNISFLITYLDKDGELLSITNDTIIEHILRVTTSFLRIFIQRKGEIYQYSNDSLRKKEKITNSPQPIIEFQSDFRLISSIIDVEILPVSYRRVRLHRYKESKPLGFYIRDGVAIKFGLNGVENVPGVYISRLLPGGLADSTGLLSVGDEIIEVNGIQVYNKSLDQVTDMMVANSHNLIITVRPHNDSFNLKSTISSSSSSFVSTPGKSPMYSTHSSYSGKSQPNPTISDDEDENHGGNMPTDQKLPSVLKL